MCCGYFRTRSISGLVTAVRTPCASEYGIRCCGYCKYWHYFVGWYCEVPGTASTRSTLNMHGILGVWRILRPSVHRVDNFMPTVLQKTFTDAPTSGSWRKLLSVEATGVFASTDSISVLYRANTRSISWFCTAHTILPVLKVCGVRHCGYCLYSGVCSAHTPSTRSIWAFSSARALSTRSIQAASTAILSVLRL